MNPYQKSAALVLRFVGLALIVYGLLRFVLCFVVYSTLTGGSPIFAAIFPFAVAVDVGMLRAQAIVAGFLVGAGIILLPVSKPLGRPLGRGLES